jgi:hypothetical protein
MINRAISIAAILLVILGVGILVTKASPRVGRHELVNQRVEVAGNDAHSLAVMNRRLELFEEMDQSVKVDLQNVRALNERVHGNVSREMLNRLVGNEADTLRGVMVDNLPVLLNARYRGNHFYLNDGRNPVNGMKHLNKDSYLAVYNLRAGVPRQLDNVLSGLRPGSLQKVVVFETVKVLKNVPGDDVLATPVLTSFEVSGAKVLLHQDVGKAVPLVRGDAVNVTGSLCALGLAVV